MTLNEAGEVKNMLRSTDDVCVWLLFNLTQTSLITVGPAYSEYRPDNGGEKDGITDADTHFMILLTHSY